MIGRPARLAVPLEDKTRLGAGDVSTEARHHGPGCDGPHCATSRERTLRVTRGQVTANTCRGPGQVLHRRVRVDG
jgi:hypothetical protein